MYKNEIGIYEMGGIQILSEIVFHDVHSKQLLFKNHYFKSTLLKSKIIRKFISKELLRHLSMVVPESQGRSMTMTTMYERICKRRARFG